jgi:hypothetical protein
MAPVIFVKNLIRRLLVSNSLIYNSYQIEILEHECIYHAVFAHVSDYNKEESDFIHWLSNQRIPYPNALEDMPIYLERYERLLELLESVGIQ